MAGKRIEVEPTKEEIKLAFKQQKNDRQPGIDNISYIQGAAS
jgi:hypothetical protein